MNCSRVWLIILLTVNLLIAHWVDISFVCRWPRTKARARERNEHSTLQIINLCCSTTWSCMNTIFTALIQRRKLGKWDLSSFATKLLIVLQTLIGSSRETLNNNKHVSFLNISIKFLRSFFFNNIWDRRIKFTITKEHINNFPYVHSQIYEKTHTCWTTTPKIPIHFIRTSPC